MDTTKANKALKLLLGMVLLSGVLGLSACQKADDSSTSAVNNKPNNTVTTTAYSSESANSIATNNISTADQQLLDSDHNSESVEVIESAPTSEIQVTDVEYQDSNGRSIYVTFKTSATSTLQADLRLPNTKRVLLTAPTGQGNNPTYHSTDGSIELVTHGGGAIVDLFYNNKRTKFNAIETEAEVLKPQ